MWNDTNACSSGLIGAIDNTFRPKNGPMADSKSTLFKLLGADAH